MLECVYMYHMCRHPQRLEEHIESPRTGIVGHYELLCECWELNLRLLYMLLTNKSASIPGFD